MSLDALRQVLRRADASAAAILAADDVAGWPHGSLETLAALGLLREDAPAKVIICPGCDMQCLKEVELIGEGKNTRAIIICDQRDDMEPIDVPLERLRRWTVDLGSLANGLASRLGGQRQAEEVVRGRLWRLGQVPAGELRADVFLARGTRWDDAVAIFGQPQVFRGSSLPVVLTLSETPAADVFGERTGVVSLSRALSLEDRRLGLDARAITQAVRLASAETSPTVGNVFRSDGEKLTATFNGMTKHFSDTKGMRAIAYLLAHPGENVPALVLARVVEGGMQLAEGVHAPEEGWVDDARSDPFGETEEVLSQSDIRRLKQRAAREKEQRERALKAGDHTEATRLEKSIAAIERTLKTAVDHRGRPRRFAGPKEKARKSVTNNIRSALKRIEREHHDLWKHLNAAIHTGGDCSYRPASELTWIIQ
jgi:hypothetical protein